MAVADGNFGSMKLVSEVWTIVEATLSEMAIEHLLDDKGEQEGFILCFNSSQVVRGLQVIFYLLVFLLEKEGQRTTIFDVHHSNNKDQIF